MFGEHDDQPIKCAPVKIQLNEDLGNGGVLLQEHEVDEADSALLEEPDTYLRRDAIYAQIEKGCPVNAVNDISLDLNILLSRLTTSHWST